MSELAFDKEGNPFRFSRRTKKLRLRRWKNAGQRGTCAAVLDADGEQVFIDPDAEFVELRAAVGNVPGFYRLDQSDENGAPVEDAPPAYVSIESPRHAAPVGEADPRDAIIRDLAQINADVTRTIAERFGNVMQAAADILRAADAAGLPRREPPPPAPAPAPNHEEEDDDGDDDHDDDESAPSVSPFGPLQPLVEMAIPHLPQFGAFLWTKFQEFMKQNATTPPPVTTSHPAPNAPPPPATTPPPAPNAPPPATTPAPEPNATSPAPAAPSPAPNATTYPPTQTPHPAAPAAAVVATGPGLSEPVSAPAPVAAPASAGTTVPPSLAHETAAPIPSSTAPTAATNEGPPLDSAAPSTTASAIPAAMPDVAVANSGPRNAPPGIEPTPEQWAHLLAIRDRLSPREAAIVDTVVVRMAPEDRAQWLAELSVLSVDQATDILRSMIPKAPPRPPLARNGINGHGKGSEGSS